MVVDDVVLDPRLVQLMTLTTPRMPPLHHRPTQPFRSAHMQVALPGWALLGTDMLLPFNDGLLTAISVAAQSVGEEFSPVYLRAVMLYHVAANRSRLMAYLDDVIRTLAEGASPSLREVYVHLKQCSVERILTFLMSPRHTTRLHDAHRLAAWAALNITPVFLHAAYDPTARRVEDGCLVLPYGLPVLPSHSTRYCLVWTTPTDRFDLLCQPHLPSSMMQCLFSLAELPPLVQHHLQESTKPPYFIDFFHHVTAQPTWLAD